MATILLSAAIPVLGQTAPESRNPRLGVLVDNYPFSFRRADGRVEGFAYELLQEIEQVMGLRFERIQGSTAEINGAFRERRVDLLQSFARSPERESTAEFSVPYLTMTGQIFVRAGGPDINSLADLKGRRVLVHRGSLGEELLRKAGLGDAVIHVESVEQALVMLDRGEGDATLATRLTGLALAHRLGLTRLRALDVKVEGYEVAYCIAVQKGNHVLLAQINEGMALLVRTGQFDKLYRQWFGFVTPAGYSAEHVLLAVAVGLALALGVAIWAVVRQRTLAQRIARQTEALRESEQKLRNVIDGLGPNNFVGLLALDGTLLEANRPALVAAGLRLEDVLGKPVDQTYWFAYSEAVQQQLRAAVGRAATGGSARYDVQVRVAQGRLIWLDFSIHPLRDPSGRVIYLVPSGNVIDERKQAEAAVQKSEASLATAQALVHLGSWELDLATMTGNYSAEMFRLLYRDPALGVPPFVEFLELVHPDDRRIIEEALARTPVAKSPYTIEYRTHPSLGPVRQISATIQVIRDASGQPVRTTGTALDITERKRAEEALHELSARLLRAQDEERRRIARELHDSTAQELAAVGMNLGRLQESIEGRDPKHDNLLADSLAILTECGREIRTLSYVLHPQLLDELGLVGALQHYVEGFSARSGLRVELEAESNRGSLPVAIETVLFRVVQESLANVLRHSGSSSATVRLRHNDGCLELTVADRGRGLPVAFLGSNGGKARLGVGIAGMRERLRHFDGRLEFSSNASGTTVRATVPLSEDRT